jgi:hypothetical protein
MSANFIQSGSYPAFNEYEIYNPIRRLPTAYKVLPVLSASNNARQGVEIKSSAELYNTTQPKIWAGSIKRDGTIEQGYKETDLIGLGQTLSFRGATNEIPFLEKQTKFDAAAYVANSLDYSFPIQLNGGLAGQSVGGIIEPLTIPLRLPSIESNYYARGVHASMDVGPATDGLGKGNQIISQFIDYYDLNQSTRPFLDEGQQIFGNLSGAIYLPGYSSNQSRVGIPFTEKDNNYAINELTGALSGSELLAVLQSLDFSRDEDIRRTFERKSAPAGYDSYGPGMARQGTDSISYSSRLRGS